jgi:hypothetical protein
MCAVAALSGAASAQLLGDKSESMGGAGLAGYDHNLNPARLSLYSTYGLSMPMIEYRASGRDIGSVTSYLRRIRTSGLDSNRFLASLGRVNGSSISDFGGSIGVVFGSTSLTYLARGYEELLPSNGALDIYGVAYEGYQFSYGQDIPIKAGQLSLGTSARMLNASYDHQRLGNGSTAKGLDTALGGVSKSGFGLDLGLTYKPDLRRELNYALVIRNLVQPGIAFDRQMPDGSIRHNGVEPFRTTVSAGIGGQLREGTWFAVDGIDLTNAVDRRQLAVGVDHQLNRYLSLQLGYNSRTSFTVGLSLFGIHARLAGRTPLTIESGVRF